MTVLPQPVLAIVIVAYKSGDEIGACLESLPKAIGDPPAETIVVDNSSDERTEKIVRERFSWAKYMSPAENLGFGRANNLGYSQTSPASEFVLFLNPDTVCNSCALLHCIRRLQADRSIGLISPKLVLADGSMDLACRRSIPSLWDGFCRAVGLAAAFPRSALYSGYNLTHLPEDGTYDVGAINGAFMMGRRSVFDAVAVADCLTPRPPVAITSTSQPSASSLPLKAPSLAPKASSLPPPASTLSPNASSLAPSISSIPPVFDESFFMYGDDLDLCIRVARAGWKIVYDGSVSITHLKGTSVAKDYEAMSRAIFDANREVYLKHFNPRGSRMVRWKYIIAFGIWKRVAGLRAAMRGHRQVRPL